MADPSFTKVDTWIFDLDNTLYPRSINLFAQIDVLMREFIQNRIGLDETSARAMQKRFYGQYGTTLRGLMEVYGVEASEFLDAVHDIDYSIIPADERLAIQISTLPGRKIIFTNGTVAHAENVLKPLGLSGQFDKIYDIVWADLIPKPERVCYEKLVSEENIDPISTAMFEDLPRNLLVPHEMGMRTILITNPIWQENSEVQSWEMTNDKDSHIEFQTDNLAEFLEKIAVPS